MREGGAPVAFAQIERAGDSAEIAQVYVRPEFRGSGRGTSLTAAAIRAAGTVRDLWIVADDEDRPKTSTRGSASAAAWTKLEAAAALTSAAVHRGDLGEPAHGQLGTFDDEHGPPATADRAPHPHVAPRAERMQLLHGRVGDGDTARAVRRSDRAPRSIVAVEPARQHGVELFGEGQRQRDGREKGRHTRQDADRRDCFPPAILS